MGCKFDCVKLVLCLFIQLMTVSSRSTAQDITPVTLFESLRLNSLSLRQFDVLVHHSTFADKAEAGSTTSDRYIRLVADIDAEKCMYCTVGKFESVVMDEGGKAKSETGELIATKLAVGKKVFSREWPQMAATSSEDSFHNALGKGEFPLMMFVGLLPYPPRTAPLYNAERIESPLADPEKLFSYWKGQWARGSVKQRGDIFQLTLGPYSTRTISTPAEAIMPNKIDEIQFDVTTQLPIRKTRIYELDGERSVDSVEFFKWEEIDGFNVVKEISVDRRQSVLFGDRRIVFAGSSVFEFRYVSVNAKVDAQFFDAERLNDAQFIRTLVDPLKVIDSR